jgi:outer membrane protein assembly factor BamB
MRPDCTPPLQPLSKRAAFPKRSLCDVGSDEADVYALNASTGALLWSYNIGEDSVFTSRRRLANGSVYVGTLYGVFAFYLPNH